LQTKTKGHASLSCFGFRIFMIVWAKLGWVH
jgi:hypothetical protein